MKVRFDGQQDFFNRRFDKKGHIIHAGQGRNDPHPSALVYQGAPGALQLLQRGIGIQRDDKDVALGFGLLKVSDMADVDEVKAAVGQDNGFPQFFFPGDFCGQLRQGKALIAARHPEVPGAAAGRPLHA